MNAQTTRAVLCVGAWSRAGYVKSADLRKAAQAADVDDEDEGVVLLDLLHRRLSVQWPVNMINLIFSLLGEGARTRRSS